jgi:integrase/recombinase XerD
MDKSKVSDHNMLIYERYTDRAASDGASSITIKNMQNTVLPFLVWLEDIDVEKVTEDKIYAYFRYLKEFRFQRKDKLVGYSPMTLYNQKSYIKKFMSKYHPTVASTIKNPKITKRKLPEDILTQIEIKKLVKACLSERDRALVATLYETGMRRGEMRALKIKDVEFDTYGAVLSIPEEGKTGARRNRLVYCVSYLNEWSAIPVLNKNTCGRRLNFLIFRNNFISLST